MRILSLDIGTNLGWATSCPEGIDAGTKILANRRQLDYAKKLRMDRRLDVRVMALTDWLWAHQIPDWIVFEDVRWVSSQAQGHLYGSLRGSIWTFAHKVFAEIECLDTSKLKLWTTGHGGATKEMMLAAAKKRWPEHVRADMDDNAVDALCLLMWGRETIKV